MLLFDENVDSNDPFLELCIVGRCQLDTVLVINASAGGHVRLSGGDKLTSRR